MPRHRLWRKEAPGFKPGVPRQVAGRPLPDDRAAVQDHHALAACGVLDLARQEDRRAPVGARARKKLLDLRLPRCVQQRQRLVEHEQRRLGDQHRGDRQQLLLAPGELSGVRVGVAGEADLGEHPVDGAVDLLRLALEVLQHHPHLLADDRRGEAVLGVLGDEAGGQHRARRVRGDRRALDLAGRPRCRQRNARKQRGERALAGAVGAEDDDGLPGTDIEADVVESGTAARLPEAGRRRKPRRARRAAMRLPTA